MLIDINECLINNGGCHAQANCTNTQGSFSCDCNIGYSGDGFSCEGSSFYYYIRKKEIINQYIDINECLTNNGGCHAQANCTNTQGSFSCTCNEGYYGSGFDCEGSSLSKS